MMVPKSYQYSGPTPTKHARMSEKHVPMDSAPERKSSKSVGKKEKAKTSAMPTRTFTPSPPTPSKPVVIPTRTRNNGRRTSGETVYREKGSSDSVSHDPSSTPPSMAALLAMTTIPEPGYKAQKDGWHASSFADKKSRNTGFRGTPPRSISSSSPQSWGMLLSPPEEFEHESRSFESDTTLGPQSSLRSLSTESMPSLDEDTESLSSASNPATPGFSPSSRRRQKSLSTSVGENCASDHPLLPPKPRKPSEDNTTDDPPSFLSPPSPSHSRSTSFFKSNLTASFRRIRSAAQSFSAFTAPPTQQSDYLARSLLSLDPQFTDERRPLPSTEAPDPSLRRYLNPPPTSFSPADLHFHSSAPPQVTPPPITASIQLQTYQRHPSNTPHNFDKASSPPIFTSAQQKALDAVDGISMRVGREPRENSDFLRVVVLEMNMRRGGKLGDGVGGRARLWLPARADGKAVEGANDNEKGDESVKTGTGRAMVPRRWEGILA